VVGLRQRDSAQHDDRARDRAAGDRRAVVAVEQRGEQDPGEDRELPDAGQQPAGAGGDRERERRVEQPEADRAPAEPRQRARAERRDHGRDAAARRDDRGEQRQRHEVAQARRPLPRPAADLHAAVEHERGREQQRRQQPDAHRGQERHPRAGRRRGARRSRARRSGGGEDRAAEHRRKLAQVRCSAMASREPAYRRLAVDERRRRLLELGAELFSRHTYAELSMSAIAREAGISKALLYHYFPSKQAYFAATLRQQAEELAARTATDPSRPPAEQLTGALDAFLRWVEENAAGYAKLLEGASTHAEVRDLVDQVRAVTAARILGGLSPGAPPAPALRAAVHGWLWFMDGAITDWLAHRDMERDRLLGLLLGTLYGAVTASGVRPEALSRPA
jgi:AcrR family transcriptional regulator